MTVTPKEVRQMLSFFCHHIYGHVRHFIISFPLNLTLPPLMYKGRHRDLKEEKRRIGRACICMYVCMSMTYRHSIHARSSYQDEWDLFMLQAQSSNYEEKNKKRRQRRHIDRCLSTDVVEAKEREGEKKISVGYTSP